MDVRATALHPSALLFCAVAGLRYGSEMPLARERKKSGRERETVVEAADMTAALFVITLR